MSAKKKTKKPAGAVMLKRIIPVLVIALLAAGVFLVKNMTGSRDEAGFQKGMGYVTWSKKGYLSPSSGESLAALKETGTNWVAILVTWYQTTCWSGDIKRTEKTPSDEAVIRAIRTAHELGMKVMLKPHLDLLDKSDGGWRGEIVCAREAEWDEWFKKYGDFIFYYAEMAKKEDVELFCIGTELSSTATSKGYLWNDMIKKIKTIYPGLLTYAAHWDRYQDIRFWNLLDYIGINAYFPLSEEMMPTVEQMKEGWKRWVTEMEKFQTSIGKPVIFPEIGCSSADGAVIRPWEHVPRTEVNLKLQEDYYTALLETFWDKDWFHGLYWWYWGTNKKMGGMYNRGFTPQNKPAEQVVKKWYSKPAKR